MKDLQKKILENGDYYIGEFKNGLRNGKGILYINIFRKFF